MTNELPWRRLVGAWRGRGEGSYPDVAPFRYLEHTVITVAADWNMLHVVQETWLDEGDGVKKKALHLETGLIMRKDDGSLLYSCAQDSGRTEVMVGKLSSTSERSLRIDWETTVHANDARLVRAGRTWSVEGDTLHYSGHLSTVRTPEYRKHIEARLIRAA